MFEVYEKVANYFDVKSVDQDLIFFEKLKSIIIKTGFITRCISKFMILNAIEITYFLMHLPNLSPESS